MALQQDSLQLLRRDTGFRDTVRRELLTEELLSVPTRLQSLTTQVELLVAAQRRTEERLDALAAAQQRTEERLDALAAAQQRTEERLQTLTAAQQRTETALEALIRVVDGLSRDVHSLMEHRRGDEGRREEERYERDSVRHAFAIFCGGRGACDRPEDLDRLRRALEPIARHEAGLDDQDDPFLADILWLKGERLAVVELSGQVDTQDVERAARRAETLRRAGIPAIGMVISRDWCSEDASRAASARSIDWRVAEEKSAGYLAFRRDQAG